MAVEKRLMHYASFDTQSSEESTSAPSTEKQLVLARELKAECEKIGFDSVELTDTGIVYAYLNANTDKKMDRIGFIAHMARKAEHCLQRDPRHPGRHNARPAVDLVSAV